MQQQVDALMNEGVGIDAVIQAAVLRAGRKLTNQEIRLIKARYNAKWNAGKNTPVNMLQRPPKRLENESNAGKGSKASIGGNGAESELPSLNGVSKLEAKNLLEKQSFKGRVGGASSGGWETFKHPDGSQIDINWNTGRTVRTAAPKYGSDGSRINKGQRLDFKGAEIPRNIPHDQHPK